MKQSPGDSKPVAKNKKAFHSYYIDSRYEVGIELLGTEVKSIRQGKVNLADAYCRIYKDRELHVHQLNIAPYDNASYVNHEPLRKRRLLMHKREILKAAQQVIAKRLYSGTPDSLFQARLAQIGIGPGQG